MPLFAAGIFVAGQFVEGNILQPFLVGKEIGLHPVWLMFALIAFGLLFGFVGLAGRGAGRGRDRRAGAFPAAAISRKSLLYRRPVELSDGAALPRQLALALDHAERLTREDFLPGPSNEAALAMIDRWPDWPARALAVVGPEGSGKSHLAAIWADESGARFLSARALELADLPASLATGALVLEDCAGGDIDERALFHLLNLVREEEAWLLLTARSLPATWPATLPDLASRLRVGAAGHRCRRPTTRCCAPCWSSNSPTGNWRWTRA